MKLKAHRENVIEVIVKSLLEHLQEEEGDTLTFLSFTIYLELALLYV